MLAASDVALFVDIPIGINIFLIAEGANLDCFCLNYCVHIYLLLITITILWSDLPDIVTVVGVD